MAGFQCLPDLLLTDNRLLAIEIEKVRQGVKAGAERLEGRELRAFGTEMEDARFRAEMVHHGGRKLGISGSGEDHDRRLFNGGREREVVGQGVKQVAFAAQLFRELREACGGAVPH